MVKLSEKIIKLPGTLLMLFARFIYLKAVMPFKRIADNKILFFSTPAFSDNGKALYDYLKSQPEYRNYEYVWLIRKEDKLSKTVLSEIHPVVLDSFFYKGPSLRAIKEILTSNYIFFTHTSPFKYVKRRKKQIIVNLWHGCGYKDIHISKPWIRLNPCDIGIVPGNVFVDTKTKFWSMPRDRVLPIGYPRYDLLMKENSETAGYVRSLKGEAGKLIIWMPTFRKSKNDFPESHIERQFELPILNSKAQMAELNSWCAEHGVMLCVKRHPLQLKYECDALRFTNIVFISNDDLAENEIDLYSFLRYTDALISDYSSVAIDYLLLDRPMAFALDDFKEYGATRGFVFDDPLKYMPGHHIYTFEDMKRFILDAASEKDVYADARHRLMSLVHNPCDNYCERIWQTVVQLNAKENH